MLRFMGSQRVRHDWVTELNWTDPLKVHYDSDNKCFIFVFSLILTNLTKILLLVAFVLNVELNKKHSGIVFPFPGDIPHPGIGPRSLALQADSFPIELQGKPIVSLELDSSVQISCSVMSDSLRPHELQHVRPPYPSPTPRVYPNPCPSSQWCHPTISSSVVPFSFCLQSFPASGSFPVSQFFTSGGQKIGVSASASVLPMNIQGWFPLGLNGLISLQSKGLSRIFSNTTVQKYQFFGAEPSLRFSSLIHIWLLEKT